MKNDRELKIPILNNEYSVIVCWGSVQAIKKIVRAWHKGNADMVGGLENNRGMCYYKYGYHPIIALPCFPKTAEQIGTLAHEAVHAVNHIFEAIQENSRDEAFAHSVGAVVRLTLKNSK